MSIFEALGWPQQIQILVLSVSIVLVLTPVLSGLDFGFVKIPKVDQGSRKWIAVAGFILLSFATVAGVPLMPQYDTHSATADKRPQNISLNFRNREFGYDIEDRGSSYALTSSGLTNTGSRSYIVTKKTDYLSEDFVADLVYYQDGGGGLAGVFFGLGSARLNRNFFDEPLSSIFFLDHPRDFSYQGVSVRGWGFEGSSVSDDLSIYSGSKSYSGLAMMRIKRVQGQITFLADMNYSGLQFTPNITVEISEEIVSSLIDPREARIFFGSASERVIFHSFAVY